MFFKSNKSEVDPKPNVGIGDKSPAVAESAQAKPSAEESAQVRRRATQSKQLQASFGEIVGLLMRSPQFKAMPLSQLEELVVPGITTGQFMIAAIQTKRFFNASGGGSVGERLGGDRQTIVGQSGSVHEACPERLEERGYPLAHHRRRGPTPDQGACEARSGNRSQGPAIEAPGRS